MTEDILDLMEKEASKKIKCETLRKEIMKKCDEAKEKWISDKTKTSNSTTGVQSS